MGMLGGWNQGAWNEHSTVWLTKGMGMGHIVWPYMILREIGLI